MTDRDELPPLGQGQAGKLIAYYREHGESQHLAAVEAALTDEFRSTLEIVAASGKSPGFCRNALEYLAVEGRAVRDIVDRPKRFFGVDYKYVWRRPDTTQPLP